MFAKRHAALAALSLAAPCFAPLAASGMAGRPGAFAEHAQLDDGSDEDAQFYSDSPFLIPDRPPTGNSRNWMKFGTDGCGVPDRVQGSRSTVSHTAFGDDESDAFDEVDPVGEAWATIADLFATEPEIAVVNDGVDTSCDEGFPAFDDPDPEVIALGGLSGRAAGRSRQ